MYLTQPGEPWKEMRPFLDDAYKRFNVWESLCCWL